MGHICHASRNGASTFYVALHQAGPTTDRLGASKLLGRQISRRGRHWRQGVALSSARRRLHWLRPGNQLLELVSQLVCMPVQHYAKGFFHLAGKVVDPPKVFRGGRYLANMLELILGDCTNLSPPVVPDVMIVDPPYSAHVHKSAVSQHKDGGVRERDLGFDSLSDELRAYVAIAAAKVRRWSVVYSDIEGLSTWKDYAEEAGATYIRAVPWVRWSMPQLSGDRPPQGCEMLSLFWGSQKGRKTWNGPGNLTHLSHTCLRGSDKHKCEKPLDQALDLVWWFSDPGELVFDPCAGSGTVGLACRILGREYFGIEQDAECHEKAARRLSDAALSKRDEERYTRWLESRKLALVDADRRQVLNKKAREKYATST